MVCIVSEKVGRQVIILTLIFQAILHHWFMELMRHIADVVGKEGVLSLEFKKSAVRRSLSLCFWEGKKLVMMALTHCSRDVPVVKSSVSMVGQLLSVVSTDPTIVCCGGVDSDFIKSLDIDPTRKAGVQYPFSLSPVQVEKLMHKPSFSVMGKIDMFSMLRTLLIRIAGMLDESWVQSTRLFRKVRFVAMMFNSYVSMYFGLSGSCVFKALEDASLDLQSAFLVVQEMLSHWAQIVSYISETGQRQEFQNVHGRVSLIILLVLSGLYCLTNTLMMLQGQPFDVQVTGDELFECRLELFKVIVQDYREAFKRSSCPRRDQGFFLCGQMLNFLHRLLRRIVERDTLPDENDWETLRQYDFVETKFLDVPSFIEKTEFRAKAMRVAKQKIDVEREKSKQQKPSETVARSVIGATFNPFIDTGRAYIRYVAKELIKHPSFKSDLVMGMTSFDYSTLFVLPRVQAIECYRRVFQRFSSRGWLAKELKNVHMDDYVEFIDNLRHVYLDNAVSGPIIDDMVTFLASCPELNRREYTLQVFKLCCLCLGHVCPMLPSVGLSCPMGGTETVDLSSVIEPLQSYLLCGELTNNFFTDPESIARCVELVDNFGDQALRAEYNPWENVDFHGRDVIVEGLSKAYKAVRVASDVDTSSMSRVLQSPGKLAMQRRTPVQAPKINFAKTGRAGTASALVGKLR